MSGTIIYFHCYIILDFPITYTLLHCFINQECPCIHETVNIVFFFVKSNENTYPKGRALMQMYRVVPVTKRGNYTLSISSLVEYPVIQNSLYNVGNFSLQFNVCTSHKVS